MPKRQNRATASEALDTRPAPEQFLATFPPEIQDLAQQLRRLVKQTIPNIAEAVYPGWRLIGYRQLDNGRGRYFCFIAPSQAQVLLGFEYGALLSDSAGLLEGTGKQVRHVTIRSRDDIRPQALAALIAEAAMVAATVTR